jgi:hypothetical protein
MGARLAALTLQGHSTKKGAQAPFFVPKMRSYRGRTATYTRVSCVFRLVVFPFTRETIVHIVMQHTGGVKNANRNTGLQA